MCFASCCWEYNIKEDQRNTDPICYVRHVRLSQITQSYMKLTDNY